MARRVGGAEAGIMTAREWLREELLPHMALWLFFGAIGCAVMILVGGGR